MDKIFNFFSKGKTKEEIEKQRRNTIINTQNLQNLANVNESSIDNNNKANIDIQNNTETIKTINFTSQDFDNIDKIMNQKQEDEIKTETNRNEQDINSMGEIKSDNLYYKLNINNSQNNLIFNKNNKNEIINTPAVGDVVMVNSIDNIRKTSDGFYTKKYKEQITNLKSV